MLLAIRRKSELHPVFSKAIPTAAAANDGQGGPAAELTVFTATSASTMQNICKQSFVNTNLFTQQFQLLRKLMYEDEINIYQGCLQGFKPTLPLLLR